MSRLIKIAVAFAIIAGAMAFFASRVSEQPLTRQEVPVKLDALGK